MFTFGKQAGLGKFLVERRDETIKALTTGKQYIANTEAGSLPPEQRAFHYQGYLGAIYSAFEGYLLDVAVEVLECFPQKLKDSDIKLSDYTNNPHDFVSHMVDRQMNALGYKRFEMIAETVMKYFQPKPLRSTALPVVQELKATRDLYVHNKGYWNTTYHGKAGPNARTEPQRGPLPLDLNYLSAGTDAALIFVKDFHDQGPRQYERCNKKLAFQQMWEATYLNTVMPFSRCWMVESANDMVRPSADGLGWGWSSSEKMLFDFFLSIFNPDHPDIETKIQDVIGRWPIGSREGQVILSWMRSPFYF